MSDRVLPPLPESHTASPGAGIAAVRLSPIRRHFVPPKVAQVPILPKWRDDTAPRLPLSTGISGWSVPNAGAVPSIWW